MVGAAALTHYQQPQMTEAHIARYYGDAQDSGVKSQAVSLFDSHYVLCSVLASAESIGIRGQHLQPAAPTTDRLSRHVIRNLVVQISLTSSGDLPR